MPKRTPKKPPRPARPQSAPQRGPQPDNGRAPTPAPDTTQEVDTFLGELAATPKKPKSGRKGRLIFALDATMSRQPTWDRACHIQADMFEEAAKIGGLEIMLVYFRGFRECRASKWHESAAPLQKSMLRIHCEGGYTQIGRMLKKALKEAKAGKVDAVVYVGDCCEEEIDPLCGMAGELGLIGVPVFVFQEGREPYATKVFKEIARLSGGAWCPFDLASASQLKDLLSAVAVYAAGGRTALEDYGKQRGGDVKLLIDQFPGNR